jgi:RHS repeat-associated protein
MTRTHHYDAIYKFTGKERDAESGLDNFGARYNASTMGRFMTPDPLLNSGRPWNPQTWNRYAYALDNPLVYVDPDGEDSIPAPSYHLGSASMNTFVPSGQSIDPSVLATSVIGGLKSLKLRDFDNSQPMAIPRGVDSGAGGCVIGGCASLFNIMPVGVSIDISFSHDPDTNKVTGANIQFSIDSSAPFIGPDPPAQRSAMVPHPGFAPIPELISVTIDPSALVNRSPEELSALFKAGGSQSSAIRNAIRNAILQEEQRRAEEQRKKEEERKRKCQQEGKKDCS